MVNTHSRDIWLDMVSPAHPFFFHSLTAAMGDELQFETTVRRKTETIELAASLDFDHTVIGRDFDNPQLRKLGIPLRALQLIRHAPDAYMSLCSRDVPCLIASKVRGIPSVHFTDNDITAHIDGLRSEEIYTRLETLAAYTVVPSAFETRKLTQHGVGPDTIYEYDGYKEDVSIAAFDPDPSFTEKLPFNEYIVLRPEALTAAYVDLDRSIVPDIISGAIARDLNVIYLPRGREDNQSVTEYADHDRVYIPEAALDGLQLAWHATCVLTGSGTMAREAACMGKPSVSFFPNTPLSVDQQMIDEGRIFHSRSPTEILDFLESLTESDIEPDRSRSADVLDEVVSIVTGISDRI